MTDTERQHKLNQILAEGLRLGLTYEDDQYFITGFLSNPPQTIWRVKVDWLLDEGEGTHTSDGQEVLPLPGEVQKR